MSAPRGYGPGPSIHRRRRAGGPVIHPDPMYREETLLPDDLIRPRIPMYQGAFLGEDAPSFLKTALLWPISLPMWVFDNIKTKSDLMVPVASGALAFGLYRYLAGSWRLPVNVEDFAKLYGVPAASVFVFDSYVVGRL